MRISSLAFAGLAALAISLDTASAATTTLYSFNGLSAGSNPYAGLVADKAGNLYGTTFSGGSSGNGLVFKLSPPTAGKTVWTETTLYQFEAGADGAYPLGGLTLDKSGNLYGTTENGGPLGHGTVYKLSSPAMGKTAWKETVLHRFTGSDGANPKASMIFDSTGNLYGTTSGDGSTTSGTVFELAPPAAGKTAWRASVLHRFAVSENAYPAAALALGMGGTLYGTTASGGTHGDGTVFALAPPAGRRTYWKQTVLYNFTGLSPDGSGVQGGVAFDKTGNLYGTTTGGGASGSGTVFELSPPPSGTTWKETVLHSFSVSDTGGAHPNAGVTVDPAGNLYGTAYDGGSPVLNSPGVVYKLSPPATGNVWKETVLHRFTSKGTDGASPYASLLLDKTGALYGTTSGGGSFGCGTVFKVTP